MSYSGVVLITDVIDGLGFRGSGVVIGPHTVLTASHMFWDQDLASGPSQVSLYPNYQPGNSPVAGQEAVHYFQVNDAGGMEDRANSAFDFAIVDTSADLSAYGPFGVLAGFSGGTVHLTGYPASAGVTQTDQIGSAVADPNFNVLDYTSLSPSPGNSGGPLWVDSGKDVVGLVSTSGWATQLTANDIQTIQNWESQDSFLWSWPTTTYTFDTHGNVATETTHGADANTYFTDFNLQHANPWQYAVSTYDAFTALAFTTIKQNDGTTLVTSYDPHNEHGWRDAVTGYNTSGQITYVTVEHADGSMLYTVYDQPGNTAGYTVYEYNTAHQLVDTIQHHVMV